MIPSTDSDAEEDPYRSGERAVAPVIATILMVAITVILAAVIGAYVFGIGSTTEKTPQTAIEVTSLNAADNKTSLLHDGGDALNSKNTQIQVEVDGTRFTIEAAGNEEFSSGDRIEITTFDGSGNCGVVDGWGASVWGPTSSTISGTCTGLDPGDPIKIIFVDTVTQNKIAEISTSV